MSKKVTRTGWVLIFCCITLSLSGCAFGKFGHADFKDGINLPAGLEGKTKAEIIQTMGVPDSVVTVDGTDYWRYGNKKGYYVLLFGKTHEKDIVLTFASDIVTSSTLVDKGSSLGILATQGSVGN